MVGTKTCYPGCDSSLDLIMTSDLKTLYQSTSCDGSGPVVKYIPALALIDISLQQSPCAFRGLKYSVAQSPTRNFTKTRPTTTTTTSAIPYLKNDFWNLQVDTLTCHQIRNGDIPEQTIATMHHGSHLGLIRELPNHLVIYVPNPRTFQSQN